MLIKKSKKLLISSMLLFILLVTVGLVYLYVSNSTNDRDDISQKSLLIEDGPCSIKQQESLLSRSAEAFLVSDVQNENSERTEKLFKLEQDIIEQENFEKDANCLHTLAMLYISRGDAVNSEKYLDLLLKGLEESSPESYVFDENVNFWTIEQMEEFVQVTKDAEKLLIENDPYNGRSRLDEKIE